MGEDDEDETDFNGENDDENNMSLRSLENSLLHEERKKATYYDIRAAGSKKVGKLCLFKSSYRLGEDILGKLCNILEFNAYLEALSVYLDLH